MRRKEKCVKNEILSFFSSPLTIKRPLCLQRKLCFAKEDKRAVQKRAAFLSEYHDRKQYSLCLLCTFALLIFLCRAVYTHVCLSIDRIKTGMPVNCRERDMKKKEYFCAIFADVLTCQSSMYSTTFLYLTIMMEINGAKIRLFYFNFIRGSRFLEYK